MQLRGEALKRLMSQLTPMTMWLYTSHGILHLCFRHKKQSQYAVNYRIPLIFRYKHALHTKFTSSRAEQRHRRWLMKGRQPITNLSCQHSPRQKTLDALQVCGYGACSPTPKHGKTCECLIRRLTLLTTTRILGGSSTMLSSLT